MGLFSDTQVTRWKTLWESALPDTAVLAHKATATDSYDNAGSVTYTAYGTVACRIAPAGYRATERLASGQVLPADYMVANLGYRTDLAPTDRITANGVTYEVRGELAGRSYRYGLRVAVVSVG